MEELNVQTRLLFDHQNERFHVQQCLIFRLPEKHPDVWRFIACKTTQVIVTAQGVWSIGPIRSACKVDDVQIRPMTSTATTRDRGGGQKLR